MRLKIFHTPKPKRFSFHTRYYNENKIETEDDIKLERGSFKKYQNRFSVEDYEEYNKKERRRKFLVLSIFIGLLLLLLDAYLFIFHGYIVLPGLISGIIILKLLQKVAG